MKYFNFPLLALVTFSSCHKSSTSTWSGVAFIAYVDSSGNSLFTDGPNGYVADSVRLYYYQNGVRAMVDNSHPGIIPSQPYGVGTFTHQYPQLLSGISVQVNFGIVNNSSTIFIDLKPGVEDTLSCKFIEDDYVLDLAWYNGAPKMTAAGKGNPYFIVVK